jgi:hypothetical protein
MKKTSHPGFELLAPAYVAIIGIKAWTIKAYTRISHILILVPFRTTKDSFLPVTFIGLADLFPQLGSSHQQLCGNSLHLALVVHCQNTYNCCRRPGFKPNPYRVFHTG